MKQSSGVRIAIPVYRGEEALGFQKRDQLSPLSMLGSSETSVLLHSQLCRLGLSEITGWAAPEGPFLRRRSVGQESQWAAKAAQSPWDRQESVESLAFWKRTAHFKIKTFVNIYIKHAEINISHQRLITVHAGRAYVAEEVANGLAFAQEA